MKLKHYFIASPENAYHPWILSKTAMACFCLTVWALRVFLPGYIAVGAEGMDAQDLMSRVNTERSNRFLQTLGTNSQLNAAANIKSTDMISRSYFAHVNPDGDYVWPVIENQGYKPYQSLGENLAMDFTSAESVVNAWMNSPGHRANILNETFEDQGMAAVYGEFEPGHSTYLVTNLFGKLFKTSQPPATTPTPEPTQPVVNNPPVVNSSTTPPIPTPNSSTTPDSTQTTPQSSLVTPTPTEESNTNDATSVVGDTPTSAGSAQVGQTQPVGEQESVINKAGQALNKSNTEDLVTLKIVIGLFALFYFFFLIIDSIIIHQAKIRREHMASSPHALAMLFIALVNYLTLWL